MNECNVFRGVWVSPKLGAAKPSWGSDAKRQELRVNWEAVGEARVWGAWTCEELVGLWAE